MSAASAAAKLRAASGWQGPARDGRAALILLSGLPGTGKSYLAAAIAARHPATIVRTDEVRKSLFPRPRYTGSENGFVYLTCYALIRQLLGDGYLVIFDATNLLREGRKRARKIALGAGAPSLTLLTVAPPDVVAERLRQRAAGKIEAFSSDADLEVHAKLVTTVEAMNAAREPYVLVDTSRDIGPILVLVDDFLAATHARSTARSDPAAVHHASAPGEGPWTAEDQQERVS